MSIKNAEMQEPYEDRFLSIVEQSPFSIQIMSPDGYTVRVNKAWKELWGLTLEQIEGYNMLEDEQLVKNGVMPFIKRAFAGQFAEIPPILYDPNETIPSANAHNQPKRWTKAVIYPIKNSLGEVQEVVLIHEDITNQIIAEENIKASELRYRSLLENANDIIYSHDLEGNYLSLNRAGEKITGYGQEEVLKGLNIRDIIVPEQLEFAKEMTKRKLLDLMPTIYEIDILTKDKRRRTLEVSTRISYKNGEPKAVEGVARDITERKRAEREKANLAEQLEKQRKHLQVMVSNVPGVVWEAWGEPQAATQRMDFVSDYVEKMLGYTVEEWLAIPNFWLTIVHPEDRESAAQNAAETFASKQAGTNRFRWISKDGRTIWVESQSVVICNEAGKPVGMRGVTMDISERKRKEVNEQFLAQASTTLASSLDYGTTLSTIAELAVPHFADWCTVDIAGDDGKLSRLAVAHIDPEKLAWAREIRDRYPPNPNELRGHYNVFRTGKSEFYPHIPDQLLVQAASDEEHLRLMRQIGFCSAMFVPLKARGRILGVLTFVNTEGSRHHTVDDLVLAEDLANRAALAVDNASLYQTEQQLRQATERTSDFLRRLQSISESLSQALTAQQVANAVIEQGVNSLGAHAGTVILLNETSSELEIVGAINFSTELVDKWNNFSLNENIPIADAVRLNSPVLVDSISEWSNQYPVLGPLASITGSQALAAVPLIVEGRTIGALGLSFLTPQKFTPNDRAFLLALAQQCAQAIQRAQLYETEQKLRTQAETANRMKDEFLATLSHELRTPLNSILGWSQMLMSGNYDGIGLKRALTTIERNAKAQTQLIDDLLDVSRIITGKLRLQISNVDLISVVMAAVEAVRPATEAKEILFEMFFDSKAGTISVDPDRLQQIVWNLLSNAVKFTGQGGRIKISLKRLSSHVEIIISDTGTGIDEEFLPHVFDRFRQLDSSKTRRHGGLGLGLAIVRQLVELHGGTVFVTNNNEEPGATFTVNLPFITVQRETENRIFQDILPKEESGTLSSSSEFLASDELAGLKVLIVDDEEDSQELISFVIGTSGADIITVSSVSEAFAVFQKEHFDIIISDIGMPEEDGFALIKKIRGLSDEQGGKVPAIALTAYARAEDRLQTINSGFQMHISKPVEPQELILAVCNLVGRMKN